VLVERARRVSAEAGRRSRLSRLRRPSRWLPAAALATVAAVVGGLVAPSWGVADTPSRALQAVRVTVSPTGALTDISSTVVDRTPTSFTSKTTTLDPLTTADRLPVRVTAAYLLNGQPGTDLSKLEGARGHVELDVTVSNSTLRSERVQHRGPDGVPTSSYALVATPMTVVAQAELPPGSAQSVVTQSTGDPAGRLTNGVVTDTGGGTGDVVWSALLAPPQLSPTTTFRLVEQTDHFVLPTFHITAQPGIQTDPSLAHLLGTSLGSAPGNDLIAVQNAALMLVDNIDGRLSRVRQDLVTIGRSLQSQVDQIGPQATADLRATNTDIRGSLTGLESDLTDLNRTVGKSLQDTTGKAGAAIASVVGQLEKRLGRPGPAGSAPPPSASPRSTGSPSASARPSRVEHSHSHSHSHSAERGCVASQPGEPPHSDDSLIARLETISGQVATLAESTGACKDALARTLGQEVGRPGAACPPADVTILCGLGSIAQQSGALKEGLEGSAVSTALDRLDASATADLDRNTGALAAAIGTVDDDVSNLGDSLTGLNVGAIVQSLVRAVGANGSLGTDISGLNQLAGAQLGLIDDLSGQGAAKGVASEVADAARVVCLSVKPTDPGGAAVLLALLEGAHATCSNGQVVRDQGHPAAGYQMSIADFIDADRQAWRQLQADTDAAGGPLSQDVGDLAQALDAIKNALPGGNGKPGVALYTLKQDVSNLTDGSSATDPGECAKPSLPALQLLECQLRAYEAAQQDAHDGLSTAVQRMIGTAGANLDAANRVRHTANAAVNRTTADFDRLLNGLSVAANDSARSILRTGRRIISEQEQRLAASRRVQGRRLDAAAQDAIASLARSFGSARHDEMVAAGQLTADVRDVISNLGSPSGSGLLGAIAADAQLARARDNDVRAAGGNGLAYATVGRAAINEDLLQRAQLAKGLDQAAAFPSFDGGGSTPRTTTVFLFTITGGS